MIKIQPFVCVAVQADLGSLRLVPHVEGSHVHHLRSVHPRTHTKKVEGGVGAVKCH